MRSRSKRSPHWGRIFTLLTVIIIIGTAGGLAVKHYLSGQSVTVLKGGLNPFKQTAAEPEIDYSRLPKTALVDIKKYIPDLVIDMRYASDNNVLGKKFYDDSTAYLRKGTADKLKAAQGELSRSGFYIKVWDAYRPPRAQFKLWESCYDPRFVVNPYKGYSNHSRGASVDITLVDSKGRELQMPSGFDDFTARADRNYSDVSPAAAANAQMLQNVMQRNGFNSISTEWWHFDDSERDSYGVVKNPPPNSNGKKEIIISAVGDCTLTTDPRFPYAGSFDETFKAVGGDCGYFFSNVITVLENDDLTIANLENAFTLANEKADKSHQSEAFWFKADPSYTGILQRGSVEAVDIANNHSYDYLQPGFDDTVKSLKQAGLLYFGYENAAYKTVQGVKIGMFGYNLLGPLEEGIDKAALRKQIQSDMKKAESECDLVIVSFHWGVEGSSEVTLEQTSFAHYAIDNGADLVLGHHPHVLQKVERYKNRYIAYSLGNFVFGNYKKAGDKDTMIFQQSFVFDAEGRCSDFSKARVIPCYMTSVDYRNDFRPMVVEGAAAKRIRERAGM